MQTDINQQANLKSDSKQNNQYKEGTDYLLFERVRMLDKVGFTEPQEAYSIMLPKGWTHEGEVLWNSPGTSCAGTFKWLKTKSADAKYGFEIYPDMVYSWTTNAEINQFNLNNPGSALNCAPREPMNAEQYLKNIFAPDELGNPEIVKIEPNQYVVEQMQQKNEETMQELRQYGAGEMQFYQTAINAEVRWPNGTEGLIVLGASLLETVIPNVYDGSYNQAYTTLITNRIVFKYPKGENEQAKNRLVL